MKILIVGHGGREHTLLYKLRIDAPDARFWITRGNAGTAGLAQSVDFAPEDVDGITAWADANAMDLVVVGPEAPLANGICDALTRRGIAAFGPTRDAARIESSKAFTKELMARAGVPTAEFRTFTAIEPALAFIRDRGAPIVVKASGLAAGKGAIVCPDLQSAERAATAMLADAAFGGAGREIVIEQFLDGEEVSIFALTDGTDTLLMRPAQDHKRIGEGDTGPNTGGMGAYAPVSIAPPQLVEQADREIFGPVLAALREQGSPFRGLLYAGLMLTADGLSVIEFNSRFGDPETQVLLPLLDSSLLDPFLEIARGGSIRGGTLDWKDAAALTTVLASAGYPERSTKGVPIRIPASLDSMPGVHVFHAGTRLDGNVCVTAGGRVLAVTGVAPSIEEAAKLSVRAAESIEFEGKQFRRDIGWREMHRHAGTT
jgi:phosphoribosylamine---glycine ligase